VELAGQPMLVWSCRALLAAPSIEQVVVAVPPNAELITTEPSGEIEEADDAGETEFEPWDQTLYVHGGSSRSASVRLALAAAGPGDPVLVHDAARPLVTPELASKVIEALERDPDASAAIAAAPVSDTIKRVDERLAVRETLARSSLWAVQTPQVFRRAALQAALDVSDELLAAATDDAWLVERSGGRVIVVDVGVENLKVTTPLDLELAALLLARRASASA
ncbi:MAG TPA: 2-C-methyl-D-erythritol 4-phosphate cytidylyltransferase, partial [Solirubrobacteraceae bacterium]|nr:2-C-methyl-D-erythritol 4-phosphate cytidylyltransferase [Solirubrobacteraceae bacterium]